MTWFFLQLRKRDVTLYGDTQHFGQIDKRLRDEVVFGGYSYYGYVFPRYLLHFASTRELPQNSDLHRTPDFLTDQ